MEQTIHFSHRLLPVATKPPITLAMGEWRYGADAEVPPERTLLALHGLTGNIHNWGPMVAALLPAWSARLGGAAVRVIAHDLRGRGQSDKPADGPYSIAAHAADAAAILAALGLPAVNLVGHSLGAMVGVYFAAHHPAQVRRLVLIDGGTPHPADAGLQVASTVGRLGKTFPDFAAYTADIKRSGVFAEWTPLLEQNYAYEVEAVEGGVRSRVSPDAIRQDVAANGGTYYPQLPALHPRIIAPTLIARSTVKLNPNAGDILPRDRAEAMAAAIPAARLLDIPATNHYTISFAPPPALITAIVETLLY